MNRLCLILLAGMVAAPATAQPFILELKPKLKEAYPPHRLHRPRLRPREVIQRQCQTMRGMGKQLRLATLHSLIFQRNAGPRLTQMRAAAARRRDNKATARTRLQEASFAWPLTSATAFAADAAGGP